MSPEIPPPRLHVAAALNIPIYDEDDGGDAA
jgi:hypothetical protein